MLFSKKWLKNHQKFLLQFLMYIDVLMLCRKFELIPTNIFRVMTIIKNKPIFENCNVISLNYNHQQLSLTQMISQ